MATDINITNVTLPNSSIRILNTDGTLTLPWRKFFQDIFQRTGGSGAATDVAAILAQIAAIAAEAAAAQSTANSAVILAGEAIALASEAILLDALVFAAGETVLPDINLLEALAVAGGSDPAPSDGVSIYIPQDSPEAAVGPSNSFNFVDESIVQNVAINIVGNDEAIGPSLTDILAYTSLDSNTFLELNQNNNHYFGAWYDTTTQNVANTSLSYPVAIGNTSLESGVYRYDGAGEVKFQYTGIYNIQFSIQFFNSDAGDSHDARVWFQQNGVDIPYSTSIIAVPTNHSTIHGAIVLSVNIIINAAAGDTIRLMWSAEDTSVYIGTVAAGTNPTRPESPGVIITVTPVA